jgi:predicted AlkP superfamily phosphohydrolase/phosphomutase
MLCNFKLTHFVYFGYIDPGTGYVFSSILPALFNYIGGFLIVILIFLRKFFIKLIKKFYKIIIVIIALIILSLSIYYLYQKIYIKQIMSGQKKIIILAVDGMDPEIVEKGIQTGMFPNMAKLAQNGYFHKLAPPVSPQSPIVWASFITGDNPAKHGIFDFIIRDPGTYLPNLVFSEDVSATIKQEKKLIKITTFWDILSQNKISSRILFLPDTYPPTVLHGEMFSGMGTPDVLGTAGKFTYITTQDFQPDYNWRGTLIHVNNSDVIKTQLLGPRYKGFNKTETAVIPIELQRKVGNKITIKIQNNNVELSEHEFSQWIPVEFKIDIFTKIRGIAQFYLKEASPNLELYISPYNFDPQTPLFPISFPTNYSTQLAKKYGKFSTLGLPHDTWALEEDVFDDAAFLVQADNILKERENVYFGELKTFKTGVFVDYFGILDSIQHMFWRQMKVQKDISGTALEIYYKKIDDVIGKTLKNMNKNDMLIVLSDHGFTYFNYEMNLNSWLRDNGYLTLESGKITGGELLSDIDWAKTSAYAIGYNGIYINMKNREKKGIVDQGKAQSLVIEISQKLSQVTIPDSDGTVIKHIYSKEDLGISSQSVTSPDIFIGYSSGIRSSWDTAVGATPKEIIVKRTSKWSGDHLFDPSEVPGTLITNFKLTSESPRIIDIIPTVMGLLNIKPSVKFDGHNLLPSN